MPFSSVICFEFEIPPSKQQFFVSVDKLLLSSVVKVFRGASARANSACPVVFDNVFDLQERYFAITGPSSFDIVIKI